ncbi:RimK family alpha-L-glutamate ligase [Aequorivita sp. CIP111184]|uniref:ATP-grasp domain-containing protein n=1 Tax=Aequorivita sp. CIP111184 TaxID=2211356 RepID=UPI000DBC31E8|nr:hypothetical protein [Aequorivita sp. CIP111184]SRX54898.1 hypothetical protein AEQU1_01918 [Aequorivita sp. CIP111184]
MKIAIHNRKDSFSDRWIVYCEDKNIDFKIVNCYSVDIVEQLKDCSGLLWHHHHNNYGDAVFAKGLLFSLEQSGLQVFPNFNTAWHFDDKIGQKYLLEAVGAPSVPTSIFYDEQSALLWANNTTYPKVFKLRGGAGGQNVRLVRSVDNCKKLIKKSFGKGFAQHDPWYGLSDRINKYRQGTASIKTVFGGISRLLRPNDFEKMSQYEKGYVYFQDFIPDNSFDIRIVVIGDRAFGLKRMTRARDFRASGSGVIIYDKEAVDERCVKIAFKVNKKIKSQSIAFDFVFDANNNPLIVEISFGYSVHAYDKCPGYWNNNLSWTGGIFNPQEWIIENLINGIIESDKF